MVNYGRLAHNKRKMGSVFQKYPPFNRCASYALKLVITNVGSRSQVNFCNLFFHRQHWGRIAENTRKRWSCEFFQSKNF